MIWLITSGSSTVNLLDHLARLSDVDTVVADRVVRRLALAEARLVGVAAVTAGCRLAVPTAHALAGLTRGVTQFDPPAGFAPNVTPVPFVAAAVAGLAVPE